MHDDRRRDSWSLTETMSQFLDSCCINSWLINRGGITMGTFKLTAVVGLYVLIIPLFVLNWPWDQSLVVYLLMFMATPIYGSSLEETIKILSLRFTNYANHTNKVAICQNTYSLELLHFTSSHFTLLHFTFLALVLLIAFYF